jgi:hypothetical protein
VSGPAAGGAAEWIDDLGNAGAAMMTTGTTYTCTPATGC